MGYIVGVDGGGTKTTAVVTDATGAVIGLGRGGAGNYQTIGLDNATDAIASAIVGAIQEAASTGGIAPADLDNELIVVLGLAGADRPRDKANLQKALMAKLPAKPRYLVIENDARIALAGATGGKPGVVLIAGTGSIALGIDEQGQTIRCGGWGPILGDEGSGYAMGKAALIAVMRDYDGRGPSTTLKTRILAHLGITSPEELVHLVYQGPLQRPEIAKLTELVLEEAANGDEVSQAIVLQGAQELVELITAVVSRLGWQNMPALIAGIGGLMQPGNLLWDRIQTLLAESCPLSRMIPPLLPPHLGAVLLGRNHLAQGIPLEDFVNNLGEATLI